MMEKKVYADAKEYIAGKLAKISVPVSRSFFAYIKASGVDGVYVKQL